MGLLIAAATTNFMKQTDSNAISVVTVQIVDNKTVAMAFITSFQGESI